MSRKLVGDRYSVRYSNPNPSPFLKTWLDKLEKRGLVGFLDKVLDLGCGGGRNINYMRAKGYPAFAVDMVGDVGIKCLLGHEALPFSPATFRIILLNYVLMFLDKAERAQLIQQIGVVAGAGCKLFVEMYPAKEGYAKTEEACEQLLDEMQGLLGSSWQVYQKSKLRRIFWLK